MAEENVLRFGTFASGCARGPGGYWLGVKTRAADRDVSCTSDANCRPSAAPDTSRLSAGRTERAQAPSQRVGAKAANLARAARALGSSAARVRAHHGCDTARHVGVAGRVEASSDGPGSTWTSVRPRVLRRAVLVHGRRRNARRRWRVSSPRCSASTAGTAFLDAVDDASLCVGCHATHRTGAQPMAVLVQPQLEPLCSGCCSASTRSTGDERHVIVEVVAGKPDASRERLGRPRSTVVLSSAGVVSLGHRPAIGQAAARCRRRRPTCTISLDDAAERLPRPPRHRVGLRQRAATCGSCRAARCTAVRCRSLSEGPMLGPGPVAETFPEPLRPLEVALWVEPLREGVIGALHVTGAVSPRRLERSPVS